MSDGVDEEEGANGTDLWICEGDKEICDAFTEIRSDGVKMCFYNENEEAAKWNLKEDGIAELVNKPKKEGCNCCLII